MGFYLIDNNVISNYFSNSYSQSMMHFVADVFDSTPTISIITQIEALSWVDKNKTKEKILKEFILDSTIINLSSDIVDECIKIRRSRKIKTPDAIIAATAIVLNLILITSDEDFQGIQNLQLFNPLLNK